MGEERKHLLRDEKCLRCALNRADAEGGSVTHIAGDASVARTQRGVRKSTRADRRTFEKQIKHFWLRANRVQIGLHGTGCEGRLLLHFSFFFFSVARIRVPLEDFPG